MTTQPRNAPQFYLTAPTPCPYLPGREERKVFTHIVGRHAEELHDVLAQGGFRRSQTLAYRPICDSCQSCVSVRVIANDFKLSRGFRRIYTHNVDIDSEVVPPQATAEQYDLFCVYLQARHSGGGMARMSMDDYAGMVEDTHINTCIIEYRLGNGELVAISLTDVLQDGLSMVYSFYNPAFPHRSLGTYLILDHIARTRMLGLPFLYLGYWVDGSTNMAYKSRFLPQERLLSEGWVRVDHISPGKAP